MRVTKWPSHIVVCENIFRGKIFLSQNQPGSMVATAVAVAAAAAATDSLRQLE